MFERIAQERTLRKGRLNTLHGVLESPFFMPVATKGSIRGIGPQEMLTQVQSQILLMNTYHLYLKPGYDLVHELGGLHTFANWPKPILTDSGGIQEESSFLGVPLFLFREKTERTEILDQGNVIVCGNKIANIRKTVEMFFSNPNKLGRLKNKSAIYGTGNASKKIVDYLEEIFQ